MDRLSTFATLVMAAIATTALMFLTALIVWVLGPTAIYFVWLVCIPLDLVLLFLALVLLVVSLSTALHLLKLWRVDEEHRLRLLRERRELGLKMHRLELAEQQHRVHKLAIASRRYQLKRRRVSSPVSQRK
ncbi:MAG: hypothetical protein ACR2H5_00410 [Ktedonobacteraceae bacterium]